jgi:O-methyltransferase
MQSPRVRLVTLSVLRVREKSGFTTLFRGLGAIDMMMERLKSQGPGGDYYEFGLFRGYTFWYAQQSADRINVAGMRFFGFDSFEGLPEIEGNDRSKGLFFSGDYSCTRAEVTRQISEHGFDWSRATLVEGFFDKSLTPAIRAEHQMGPAALVLIDCDLYQSTVPVLRFLDALLQEGTIVLFDDWYCFGDSEDHGEPRAFREFLADHEDWHAEALMDFPIYGKAFVMHKSSAAEEQQGQNALEPTAVLDV